MRQQLQWPHPAFHLLKDATERAAAEPARVAQLSRADFSSWLAEGQSNGLKRQHQMSRSAVGWIPSKIDIPVDCEGAEPDGTDGLFEAEVASLQIALPMQSAESELKAWSDEWLVGHERIELDWAQVEEGFRPCGRSLSKGHLLPLPMARALGGMECTRGPC